MKILETFNKTKAIILIAKKRNSRKKKPRTIDMLNLLSNLIL